jgi:hypothetical protein
LWAQAHSSLFIGAILRSNRFAFLNEVRAPELQTIQAKGVLMPEKETIERARSAERAGKASTTQAGEFVREEMEHIREGKHGARSPKQAIAIGLSKARRAGVKLPPPSQGKTSDETRTKAEHDYIRGQSAFRGSTSPKRSRAVSRALKRESRQAASPSALSRQARSTARSRGSASRQHSAEKAVRTKGRAGLRRAARKAARTRSLGRRVSRQ